MTKPHTLCKMEKVGRSMCKERMRIKSFKSAQKMNEFLCAQSNNNWRETKHHLKSGLYAYAGGKWHNVKSLDACVLAHI